MLDKETVVNKVEQYVNAVKKEYSPFAVVLFGSYAKGEANDDSDIDIAIVFKGFNGDWLKASSRLWNLAYEISYDIEPHLLDTTQDRSGFVKHVFKSAWTSSKFPHCSLSSPTSSCSRSCIMYIPFLVGIIPIYTVP